ncbi:MAG TPA: DUF6529 family protein [Jatrophihabitans sp.]|jgi:hypothetical protein|nr:DUF6529 family protein [Jatrophihabitans sp.]
MATAAQSHRSSAALAWVLLAGCAVAVALGVYGREHDARLPVFVKGFSGVIQFKVWLATVALVLVLVQVTTALWMWGRLPGAGSAPGWVSPVHRWSGALAFLVLIPVALNCLLTFGFATNSPRVVAHSVAGCAFYGAYSAKMLGLRVRGLPGWTLPLLGGLVFTTLIILWLTSALWFFGMNQPLT